jgi:hypothetical protein
VKLDTLLLWPFLASFLAAIAAAVIIAATKSASRAITRWRTSKLREGSDAERVQEELEGWATDLGPAERVELAASLFFNLRKISHELAQRACETPQIEDVATVLAVGTAQFSEWCASLHSSLAIGRSELRDITNSITKLASEAGNRDVVDHIARLSATIEKRSRWTSTISKGLLANRSLVYISLLARNVPAAMNLAKEHSQLKHELREEAALRREVQTVMKRIEKLPVRRDSRRWR